MLNSRLPTASLKGSKATVDRTGLRRGFGLKPAAKKLMLRGLLGLMRRYPSFAEDLIQKAFESRYEISVPATHYYSPLPDIPILKRRLNRWHKKGDFEGVRWNLEPQRDLLKKLKSYTRECGALPSFERITDAGYGQGYGEVEAHLLHCMVRYLRPRKVIEVGSGVSTYFMLNALQMNASSDKKEFELVCVEPFPSQRLKEWVRANQVELHAAEVQDVALGRFESLGRNDILFIDSSHVSKMDSDVNWLYLEVLPRLKEGAVVHIHDIPFPYLTPPTDHPLFTTSLLWNEAALVKAFLLFNNAFEILLCESLLHYEDPAALREVVELYDHKKHFPASLWLVKTAWENASA
jgi:predicted O-methyltransferase YrrM